MDIHEIERLLRIKRFAPSKKFEKRLQAHLDWLMDEQKSSAVERGSLLHRLLFRSIDPEGEVEMSKRWVSVFSMASVFVVILLALFTFVILPNNFPQVTDAPADQTITLAVGEFELSSYEALIEQFESQNPHIAVRLVATDELVSEDTTDRLATLAAAADVFPYSADTGRGHEYLLDLRPLSDLDSTFQPDDFHAGLLDSGEALWSVPVAAVYPVIFFDKAAFDAAGLPYPQPGWTLDEFLAAAQTLTIRDGDEVTRWGYVPFYVQPLLSVQLNTSVFPDSGSPRFSDPDVATAVQWVGDLFTIHEVSPWGGVTRVGQFTENGHIVESGQAAMWSGGHTRWGSYNDTIGVTTMPRSETGYALDPSRTGLAISRGTAHPEAAWELLNFLSHQSPAYLDVALIVPSRQSIAASTNFWESVPEPLNTPLQYEVNNNSGSRSTVSLIPVLEAVVERSESVDAALAQAQAAAAGQQADSQAAAAVPVVVATPRNETIEGVAAIEFATTWNEADAQQSLARSFNADHPDIRVTVRRIDTANDFNQEIMGADCFVAYLSPSLFAESVRPLDPFLELDSELSMDDFFLGAVAGLIHDGQLLGIPGWINVPVLQYNRQLFASAGIAEPQPDWTVEQFLQTAQLLSDPAIGQYGYMDWTPRTMLEYAPAMLGVSLIDRSDGVANLNYDAAAQALSWYVDLVALYRVHPALVGDVRSWDDFLERSDHSTQLAESEKLAMWPHVPTDFIQRDRLAQAGIETGFVPMPRGPNGYSFDIPDSMTAYYIAADTLNAQACWEWIKFLTTQPTAAASSSFPYLPAHEATARSEKIAEIIKPEMLSAYLSGVTSGSDQGRLFWRQEEDWFSEPAWVWLAVAGDKVARGETTLESALSEVRDLFTRYRECVIEQNAFDDQDAWAACAEQVDPLLKGRFGS